VKRTKALARIAGQLMVDPTKKWYGYDLMKASHCFAGTLYITLGRMEDEGWIRGDFEGVDVIGAPLDALGDKPRRRIYTVLEKGRQAMKEWA
jgi:DNA-binding PadR family transcriptional regulator